MLYLRLLSVELFYVSFANIPNQLLVMGMQLSFFRHALLLQALHLVLSPHNFIPYLVISVLVDDLHGC